jgi:hypothetical protein
VVLRGFGFEIVVTVMFGEVVFMVLRLDRFWFYVVDDGFWLLRLRKKF